MDCTNKPLKAFIINIDNIYYIMIDSTSSYEKKREMLAHELAHYFTNTLYSHNANDEEIRTKEKIADDLMEELLNEKSCNAFMYKK
ncbi:MAG: ImmA/IrrE family metallo-endopeptidase [Acholeplasmatales bacterium]|nr:ImmA/IrrE family metallo-endopeptidase [Acholeplasmatales bacterium]